MRINTYLLIRIMVNGVVVLALALGWLLVSDHRASRAELAHAASAMQRILKLQLTGPTQGVVLQPRFLDWFPVTRVSRPDGTCIRVYAANRTLLRSECRGRANHLPRVPRWFARAYTLAFAPATEVIRSIDSAREVYALHLTPDAETEIARAWQETLGVAGPITLVIVVLCVTVWWSARRAVGPTREIMAGLTAIENGERNAHLGPFRWSEFDHIAGACNALAASLGANESARTALTRRLLEVQEEERYLLARELHDEFGQHLSAIAASAAALRCNASLTGSEDAHRIETSARHLMQLVREHLLRLRPWGSGEVDLPGSLHALVAEREVGAGAPGEARARPRITCQLGTLPAALAPDIASAVYRIVQEALTNAIRHANAGRIDVSVRADAGALHIEVADDGVGCAPAAFESGFGIAGIRERAAAFGGTARIALNASGGVTVSVTLPLAGQVS